MHKKNIMKSANFFYTVKREDDHQPQLKVKIEDGHWARSALNV